MPMLTHDDVVAVLGPTDDLTVSEIMGTGASRAELVQARAWLESDDAMVNDGRPLPTGRVGAVVEIMMADRADDDEAAAPPGPA